VAIILEINQTNTTNKTDCHDITEKSLKELLKTITHSSNQNAALWL
jgi:hypothetical protein